ncbi:hypothetical protein C0989_002224 [Termitomyces sp. Mn162]|nr:hypothetical protein C0989_002224 [Termitomyces sp. Mn162]
MVRFHLITVLALSTASLTLANPVDQVALQPEVPVYTTDGWRWEDCGQPTDAIRIERIIVTPDPPQPGKDMTVKVTGEAQSVIEVVASYFSRRELSFMMSVRMAPM